MVSTVSIASILQGMEGVRLVRDWSYAESEADFADSDPPAENAQVVEGLTLEVKQVPFSETSGFTHFLDGTQKARIVFWDGQMPASLAHVAAAILERSEREMNSCLVHDAGSRLFGFSESAAIAKLREAGREVTPIPIPDSAGMTRLRTALSGGISVAREQAEALLAIQWLRDDSDGWLLVDGGIGTPTREVRHNNRIVGVVKSHRKQYFASPESTCKVLGLKLGERTSVFHAMSGIQDRDESFSWYLRINESPFGAPTYGLIRVEMAPTETSIQTADEISSWLLAERSPISMPDPRHDRLLYPIRRVEMFLKSLQPSDAAMRGILGT